MSILHSIHAAGQSIWYDFISRSFITSGDMQRLVDSGVRGMTSNPTIFEQAIAGAESYDQQIAQLDQAGASTDDIATAIFVSDVTAACDVIRPVYDESNGMDGYISLEVSPVLAHDTTATLQQARELWQMVSRPNLMIKIPATPEGYEAIRNCIADGINVNVTLIFSIEQYRNVVEAYLSGLDERIERGESIDRIHSVASIFVSRIDSMIDAKLEEIGTPEALDLRGLAGLANSRLVYQEFRHLFSGPRWERIASHGGHRQRPLWASTSTKNPSYPDLIYIDNLIGPDTVNTVPPATLKGILDHGKDRATIEEGVPESSRTLERIEEVGISIPQVMADLLREGVEKFAGSFRTLFGEIERKREKLRNEEVEG